MRIRPGSLRLDHLLLILMVLGVFVIAFRFSLDSDMYWHLRVGQWQLAEREVIRTDPFSHTFYGHPWPAHSYLSEVGLYLVYRWLGYPGLSLVVALLALGGMLFAVAGLKADPLVKAGSLLLGASASAVFFSPRPQMISFLFMGVLLWLLRRNEDCESKSVFILPLLMLLWVNMHGGWPVALVFILLVLLGGVIDQLLARRAAVGEAGRIPLLSPASRRLLLALLVSLPLLLVNPYGFEAVRIPFTTLGRDLLSQAMIHEWLSPDFHNPATWPYLFLLLGTFALISFSGYRLSYRRGLPVFMLAVTALLSARNISLSALALTPLCLQAAGGWMESLGFAPRWSEARKGALPVILNYLLLFLLLVLGGVKIAMVLDGEALAEARAEASPVAAVEFLRAEAPPAQLYNHYNWGGYLIWALPEYPVYIDGRADLYGDEMIAEFLSVHKAEPGWQEILAGWGVNTLLLYCDSSLDWAASDSPEWRELYRDELAVIYQRESPLG